MTANNKRKKIMLLEDEALVAMATEQMLEDLGYTNVDVFYRLDPATEAASNNHYDVAILDVNVDKRRTSLSLARELRRNGTEVIFASGNDSGEAELNEIAVHVIGKPYQEKDLSIALEKL